MSMSYWKKGLIMRRLMSDLRNLYQGKPAAILGGGPSLPEDMKKLPKDCILIAVNYHAMKICKPDFMVYNDFPESDPILFEAVESFPGTRVSSHPSSDVVFNVQVWTGFYSSNTAAWFALWLGCDPVILCGHDLYQGERKYFHDYQHDVPCFHYPLDHHLRPWIEECRASCINPERLRAASGPLVELFGMYKGAQ